MESGVARMKRLAILGGTGVDQLDGLTVSAVERLDTPFGAVSADVERGQLRGREVIFLQRHGKPRSLPPHRINYRANLWALRHMGVTHVVALNAVGAIHASLRAGMLVLPDQIIDYTWGRSHTFDEGGDAPPMHIDFTEPYSPDLRQALFRASAGEGVVDGAVMAVTQGPRLETAAEVRRLRRDGCDVVGMTSMPEAALAREAGLAYASLCMVVNTAAGLGNAPITLDSIRQHLQVSSAASARVIGALVSGGFLAEQ